MQPWKEPSPAQSQFQIVFADGESNAAVGKTVRFAPVGQHRPVVDVTLSELDGMRFAGKLPAGHEARGTLPNANAPGMITISLCV